MVEPENKSMTEKLMITVFIQEIQKQVGIILMVLG
jgi:hypothetical protein